MKRYISGILTGTLITTMVITFIGATQAKDDSLVTIMEELDTYVPVSYTHLTLPTKA